MVKLALSGPGGSGKDALGEILRDISTLRYVAGTSKFAAAMVYEAWGYRYYEDAHSCWLDRRSNRQKWAELIGEFNASDPVALYRKCLANQDLLTGIRYRHEFLACREAGLVDAWIWIERDGIEPDPTMEHGSGECDFTIENNGDIDDLHRKAVVLARLLGVLKTE